MMDQQHWWKLLASDKSGLINTDDKASVLIQTVTIIAVTGVARLPLTVLISVLLNAVTDHAFFRVWLEYLLRAARGLIKQVKVRAEDLLRARHKANIISSRHKSVHDIKPTSPNTRFEQTFPSKIHFSCIWYIILWKHLPIAKNISFTFMAVLADVSMKRRPLSSA